MYSFMWVHAFNRSATAFKIFSKEALAGDLKWQEAR